jgi:hypothetical protein
MSQNPHQLQRSRKMNPGFTVTKRNTISTAHPKRQAMTFTRECGMIWQGILPGRCSAANVRTEIFPGFRYIILIFVFSEASLISAMAR